MKLADIVKILGILASAIILGLVAFKVISPKSDVAQAADKLFEMETGIDVDVNNLENVIDDITVNKK